jgi:DNA-binding CsgD family transcriptional regulator
MRILIADDHEVVPVDCVRLIVDGKRNAEAAEILGISVRTVETHRSNLMRRLRLRSTVELVRYAVRNHIVDA